MYSRLFSAHVDNPGQINPPALSTQIPTSQSLTMISLKLLSCVGLAATSSWMSFPGSLVAPNEPWGSCTDASWPLSQLGHSIQPQSPDSQLQQMLAEVDEKPGQRHHHHSSQLRHQAYFVHPNESSARHRSCTRLDLHPNAKLCCDFRFEHAGVSE